MAADRKRIILIEPLGDRTNVFDRYMKLPLMGPLYLGTILHNAGHDVRIINENILGRQIDAFEIDADVVCFSILTMNTNRAKALAAQIKQIRPNTKILVGSMHPSLLPQEFFDIADHITIGEAELIIEDLVDGKFAEKVVTGKPMEDMDALPLINFSLIENLKAMAHIPLMTSRGCPFDCNFCGVTKVFGKKFRNMSVPRVMAEIRNALSYFRTRDMFIYDDNLTADKKRAEALFTAMEQEDFGITWTGQVRSDIARTPNILAQMRRAGCGRVCIGFESINDATLKAYHKSQTRADIINAIRIIHEHGINIHAMFMFGEDHETLESMDETVRFAREHEIDSAQFMILTPLPGTRIFEKIQQEGRIYHEDWDYYNGMYIVFRPINMSPAKLQTATVAAYRKFYSLRSTLWDIVRLGGALLMDALTFNFSRVYRYDPTTLMIRIGAYFVVRRYGLINQHYLEYLETTVRTRALEHSARTSMQTSQSPSADTSAPDAHTHPSGTTPVLP